MTDQLVSIILPAYDAASVIDETIARIQHATIDIETEIIVVDDGSGDGTAYAALQADADHVIELEENRGKGAAVRAGASIASGSFVLFTDVDLAYEPSQILKLIEALNAGADVVLGSRRHSASQEVNVWRKLWKLRVASIPPANRTRFGTPALVMIAVNWAEVVPLRWCRIVGNKGPSRPATQSRHGCERGIVITFLLRAVFSGMTVATPPLISSLVTRATSPMRRPVCTARRIIPRHSSEVDA